MEKMNFIVLVKIARRILFFAIANFCIFVELEYIDLSIIGILFLYLAKGLLFCANQMWLTKEKRESRYYSLFDLCTQNGCTNSVSSTSQSCKKH